MTYINDRVSGLSGGASYNDYVNSVLEDVVVNFKAIYFKDYQDIDAVTTDYAIIPDTTERADSITTLENTVTGALNSGTYHAILKSNYTIQKLLANWIKVAPSMAYEIWSNNITTDDTNWHAVLSDSNGVIIRYKVTWSSLSQYKLFDFDWNLVTTSWNMTMLSYAWMCYDDSYDTNNMRSFWSAWVSKINRTTLGNSSQLSGNFRSNAIQVWQHVYIVVLDGTYNLVDYDLATNAIVNTSATDLSTIVERCIAYDWTYIYTGWTTVYKFDTSLVQQGSCWTGSSINLYEYNWYLYYLSGVDIIKVDTSTMTVVATLPSDSAAAVILSWSELFTHVVSGTSGTHYHQVIDLDTFTVAKSYEHKTRLMYSSSVYARAVALDVNDPGYLYTFGINGKSDTLRKMHLSYATSVDINGSGFNWEQSFPINSDKMDITYVLNSDILTDVDDFTLSCLY